MHLSCQEIRFLYNGWQNDGFHVKSMHVRSILSKSLVCIIILILQLLFCVVFIRIIMKFVTHFNIASNLWRCINYTRHETSALIRDVIEHLVKKKPEKLITILIEYSHKIPLVQ
jgi:hypothetical protein